MHTSSQREARQVRDSLIDFIPHELEFMPAFEHLILRSESHLTFAEPGREREPQGW